MSPTIDLIYGWVTISRRLRRRRCRLIRCERTTTWHHHEAEFHYLVAVIAIWHQVKSTFRKTHNIYIHFRRRAVPFKAVNRHNWNRLWVPPIRFNCHFIYWLQFYFHFGFLCVFNSLVAMKRDSIIQSQPNERNCVAIYLSMATLLEDVSLNLHCHRRLQFNLGSLRRKFTLKPIGPRASVKLVSRCHLIRFVWRSDKITKLWRFINGFGNSCDGGDDDGSFHVI